MGVAGGYAGAYAGSMYAGGVAPAMAPAVSTPAPPGGPPFVLRPERARAIPGDGLLVRSDPTRASATPISRGVVSVPIVRGTTGLRIIGGVTRKVQHQLLTVVAVASSTARQVRRGTRAVPVHRAATAVAPGAEAAASVLDNEVFPVDLTARPQAVPQETKVRSR